MSKITIDIEISMSAEELVSTIKSLFTSNNAGANATKANAPVATFRKVDKKKNIVTDKKEEPVKDDRPRRGYGQGHIRWSKKEIDWLRKQLAVNGKFVSSALPVGFEDKFSKAFGYKRSRGSISGKVHRLMNGK